MNSPPLIHLRMKEAAKRKMYRCQCDHRKNIVFKEMCCTKEQLQKGCDDMYDGTEEGIPEKEEVIPFLCCPNDACGFAICKNCYRGGGVGPAIQTTIWNLKRQGILGLLGLLVIIIAQAMYLPSIQGALTIIFCHHSLSCQFPECYFPATPAFMGMAVVSLFVLIFMGVGMVGFLWHSVYRRKKTIITAGIIPPENLWLGNTLFDVSEEPTFSQTILMDCYPMTQWDAILDRDQTMLKPLYEPYKFQHMTLHPSTFVFKVAIVAVVMYAGEPASIYVIIGAAIVELVQMFLYSLTEPFLDHWIDLLGKAGPIHQVVQLALLCVYRADQFEDPDEDRAVIAMIVISLIYFVIVIVVVIVIVIIPLCQGSAPPEITLVKKTKRKRAKKKGAEGEEGEEAAHEAEEEEEEEFAVAGADEDEEELMEELEEAVAEAVEEVEEEVAAAAPAVAVEERPHELEDLLLEMEEELVPGNLAWCHVGDSVRIGVVMTSGDAWAEGVREPSPDRRRGIRKDAKRLPVAFVDADEKEYLAVTEMSRFDPDTDANWGITAAKYAALEATAARLEAAGRDDDIAQDIFELWEAFKKKKVEFDADAHRAGLVPKRVVWVDYNCRWFVGEVATTIDPECPVDKISVWLLAGETLRHCFPDQLSLFDFNSGVKDKNPSRRNAIVRAMSKLRSRRVELGGAAEHVPHDCPLVCGKEHEVKTMKPMPGVWCCHTCGMQQNTDAERFKCPSCLTSYCYACLVTQSKHCKEVREAPVQTRGKALWRIAKAAMWFGAFRIFEASRILKPEALAKKEKEKSGCC